MRNGSIFQHPTRPRQKHKRYLIKWTDLSYRHVSWETATDLIQRVPDSENEILMFKPTVKDEYFNPQYCQVDVICDKRTFGSQKEYLIKWKALGDDSSTWEHEQDIKYNVETYSTPKQTPDRSLASRFENHVFTAIKTHGLNSWGSLEFNDFEQEMIAKKLRVSYLARIIHLAIVSKRRKAYPKTEAMELVRTETIESVSRKTIQGVVHLTVVSEERQVFQISDAMELLPSETIESVTTQEIRELSCEFQFISQVEGDAMDFFWSYQDEFRWSDIPIPISVIEDVKLTKNINNKLRHYEMLFLTHQFIQQFDGEVRLGRVARQLGPLTAEFSPWKWFPGSDDIKLLIGLDRHGWRYCGSVRQMKIIFNDTTLQWDHENPFPTPQALQQHWKFIFSKLPDIMQHKPRSLSDLFNQTLTLNDQPACVLM